MRPLDGRTIIVAASEERTEGLAASLATMGALVIPLPTVRITPPEDPAALDRALRAWKTFDWVVFTSTNGVEAVRSRGRELGVDLSVQPPSVAAVGPATKAAAEAAGFPVDAMPKEYLTQRIADVLGSLRGRRVLLPRSALASSSLARRLQRMGAHVDAVEAYNAVRATSDLSRLPLDGTVDSIVFTSASSAENLVATLPDPLVERLRRTAKAACIGPVTAAAARALGFRVGIVAREHTIAGLVRELQEAMANG